MELTERLLLIWRTPIFS